MWSKKIRSSLFRFTLVCSLLAGQAGLGQGRPTPLSLAELITSPKKYDRKLVTVQGFLQIESEKPHGFGAAILYPSEDDAKQLLTSKAILIVPSKQMLRDREKINGAYITLTGSFRATPTTNGTHGPEVTDIQSCMIQPRD
jgi:hypothetical protein